MTVTVFDRGKALVAATEQLAKRTNSNCGPVEAGGWRCDDVSEVVDVFRSCCSTVVVCVYFPATVVR